ncbi:MAG: PhzF family phenazine biosynthesis protein [Opitutaceae bacterium]|jgi:PhzF family phenazine biosynthesis protein
MSFPFYWVDAFTDRVFQGNPAGVVPLAQWLSDSVLQQIAFENGLSETAFFVRLAPGRHHLRWFTPRVEMDLCGHATLACAHVLFTELGEATMSIDFETRSGVLTILRLPDGKLEMDFPSRPPSPASEAGALGLALGANPVAVLANLNNWLCVYESESQVRALKPDFAALGRIAPGRVIVTAPGNGVVDFTSRFFAPGVGIDEDPVTGSAHCALIPYWAARLGRKSLHALQVSARGGELWCSLDGDRVKMAGFAMLYMKGEIHV